MQYTTDHSVFLHYNHKTFSFPFQEYISMGETYVRMNEERFKEGTDYLKMMANPNFDNLTKAEEPDAHPYVNVPVGLAIDFWDVFRL